MNTITFAPATNFAVGAAPYSVAVGDFNGDGQSDLATANPLSFDVSVLLSNGTGSFSSGGSFAVETRPYDVVVADFNGDGKSDLAVADTFSTTYRWS